MNKQILNYLVIATVIVSVVFMSSCDSKDNDTYSGHPILGTWHYRFDYYTFKANGTGTWQISGTSSIIPDGTPFKWKINGTKVTITSNSSSSMIAKEIFFDSKTGVFYDVRQPYSRYTKQ